MINNYSRHFITTDWDQKLPLHLDSVGYDMSQAPINRKEGYPSFHWLQTISGSGTFTVYDTIVTLGPNQGILLKPNTPHRYHASIYSANSSPGVTTYSSLGSSVSTGMDKMAISTHPSASISTSNNSIQPWATWYLTFDGTLASSIIAALDIPYILPIRWEVDSPLADIHRQFEEKCRFSFDFAGINGSAEVYTILALIKKFGQISGQPSLSKGYQRLTPLLMRIEEEYGNPNVGLNWMADVLVMSPQHANTLFHKVFGISPYQYLLQFRIQKSKELLLLDRNNPVKAIASIVGFHDSSHFVSTFHNHVGVTPIQFRMQYSV